LIVSSRSIRVAAVLALSVYVLATGIVLLAAQPTFATEVIDRTETWLAAQGAPGWVTYPGRVQLALNAAMFAPLTFLASLAAPRRPWSNWVAYSFIGSGAVEVFQAFALEPRSAQYVDVVANTLGGLIGALIALPLAAGLRRLSDERSH
jgi:hypothetical protein